MEKKQLEHAMRPDEYREFLRQVELKTIVLDNCSVKTNRDNIGKNMKLDIQRKSNYTIEEETSAVVTLNYDLTATKTTKKDFALKVACVYRIVLLSKRPITDAFMEIYTKINIQMNTWPYFREFVQSMIQRVQFPPLTLPLLKQ